jgi:hypothetical protein
MSDATKPALTRSQRKNLAKLADYLESLPKGYRHFDMMSFLEERKRAKRGAVVEYVRSNGGVNQCGTVACAVGHGPAAGVLFYRRELTLDGDNNLAPHWEVYTARFVPRFGREFSWAFGADWYGTDNHHWGAAARIRHLLKRGVPDGFYNPKAEWLPLYREFDKRYAEQVSV